MRASPLLVGSIVICSRPGPNSTRPSIVGSNEPSTRRTPSASSNAIQLLFDRDVQAVARAVDPDDTVAGDRLLRVESDDARRRSAEDGVIESVAQRRVAGAIDLAQPCGERGVDPRAPEGQRGDRNERHGPAPRGEHGGGNGTEHDETGQEVDEVAVGREPDRQRRSRSDRGPGQEGEQPDVATTNGDHGTDDGHDHEQRCGCGQRTGRRVALEGVRAELVRTTVRSG